VRLCDEWVQLQISRGQGGRAFQVCLCVCVCLPVRDFRGSGASGGIPRRGGSWRLFSAPTCTSWGRGRAPTCGGAWQELRPGTLI
jgi:hypothetical protein